MGIRSCFSISQNVNDYFLWDKKMKWFNKFPYLNKYIRGFHDMNKHLMKHGCWTFCISMGWDVIWKILFKFEECVHYLKMVWISNRLPSRRLKNVSLWTQNMIHFHSIIFVQGCAFIVDLSQHEPCPSLVLCLKAIWTF